MNAMEKVAWTELVVSVTTLDVVTALYPWLGNGAAGAFGLLGLVGGSAWYLRPRGSAVIVDERDRAIDRLTRFVGITTAWMLLWFALLVIVLVCGYRGKQEVPIRLLEWLLWVQFAICWGVKGLVGVVSYRRQNRAA